MAAFDGGAITSDAGALLLGETDRVIRLTERFAACFIDARVPELVEHEVRTMVLQRVVGIALGYEDLNDHDELRHDPVLAVLAGKLTAKRADCAPLAGKSTLNRLELSRPEPTRYLKVSHKTAAIETLFVDMFLEAHRRVPTQIILDLDATDDPLHGHQEGRFYHGYYDCYCYLAAVHFLRPASVGFKAAARRHRRVCWSGGGDGAHRHSDPRSLARSAHCAACRFGVCPRCLDELVRGQWGRFPVWPGEEPASGR